jgi:hypothetical protein
MRKTRARNRNGANVVIRTILGKILRQIIGVNGRRASKTLPTRPLPLFGSPDRLAPRWRVRRAAAGWRR